MIQAQMSFLGLYRADNTLLDNLYLPEQIDKEALKMRLLNDTAELEVLYTDPEYVKWQLGIYSQLRLHAWEIMAQALYKEDYDPFTNVNRHEERVETEERDLKGTAGNTSTGQVSAFNSTGFQNQNKVINDGTSTDTGTVKRSMVYDLTGDSALSDTQDLIEKEVELRQNYDLYQIIINDIKRNFCLLIY